MHRDIIDAKRRDPRVLQRQREAQEKREQWERYLHRLYPVPNQFISDRARQMFFHQDLVGMEPWELQLELTALERRMWEQQVRRCTVYGIDGKGPPKEWLMERHDRIKALLRGEMPPHAGCPHCGSLVHHSRQSHPAPSKPAKSVELHFTDGRAE